MLELQLTARAGHPAGVHSAGGHVCHRRLRFRRCCHRCSWCRRLPAVVVVVPMFAAPGGRRRRRCRARRRHKRAALVEVRLLRVAHVLIGVLHRRLAARLVVPRRCSDRRSPADLRNCRRNQRARQAASLPRRGTQQTEIRPCSPIRSSHGGRISEKNVRAGGRKSPHGRRGASRCH